MSDAAHIGALLALAANPHGLEGAQHEAAQELLAFDGEAYPADGCAITASTLMRQAGIDVPFTFQALALVDLLEKRGWQKVQIGAQQAGDIGTTVYGGIAHHGVDHVYLVLHVLNPDEMIVADNQARAPHFRFASGKGGTSPTRFFLRAIAPNSDVSELGIQQTRKPVAAKPA